MVRASVALAAACLLSPLSARAQTEPGRLVLIGGTDFPLHLGGGLSVGLGRGFRATSVVGAAIPPYLDLIQSVIDGAAGLPPSQSEALREAIRSAIVWRTHVVWRAWRSLEVAAGYGLLVVSGDVSTRLALQLAGIDASIPVVPPPPPTVVRAWIHQADVEAAWRWRLTDSLALRTGLGLGVTFYNDTTVAARYGAGGESEQSRAVRVASEERVTEALARWRVLPWVHVALELNLSR